jgi:peptidyl-tRNA hydrolase
MKSLKKLNLYNNSITLLPRNINLMQFLDELNLGRNQLQAVPVEFVEILESVPSVNLLDNPWGLLPEKWGRRRQDKETSDAPLGYSLPDALDFLYAMRSFYHAAEAVWDEFGVFYYTGRLGFNDFLQMLREKIPSTWHEGLVDYAKHVFFTSRQSGLFVRWYSLTDEEQMTVQQNAEQASIHKEQNIAKSYQDEARRQKITNASYDQNLQRRMRQAYDQIAEHHRGEEYIESLQSAAVHEGLRQAEKKVLARQIKREKIIEEQRKLELNRMFEILKEDAPVRQLEKQTVLEMAKQRKREEKQQQEREQQLKRSQSSKK